MFVVPMTYVFICIQSREVRANHSWSLEMRIEMDSDSGCELTSLELSTCVRLMPVINRLLVGNMNTS